MVEFNQEKDINSKLINPKMCLLSKTILVFILCWIENRCEDLTISLVSFWKDSGWFYNDNGKQASLAAL